MLNDNLKLVIPICELHEKVKHTSPCYGVNFVCPDCRKDIDILVEELTQAYNDEIKHE